MSALLLSIALAAQYDVSIYDRPRDRWLIEVCQHEVCRRFEGPKPVSKRDQDLLVEKIVRSIKDN